MESKSCMRSSQTAPIMRFEKAQRKFIETAERQIQKNVLKRFWTASMESFQTTIPHMEGIKTKALEFVSNPFFWFFHTCLLTRNYIYRSINKNSDLQYNYRLGVVADRGHFPVEWPPQATWTMKQTKLPLE